MAAGLALALVCVFWADVASYAAETTATIGPANTVQGSWWGEGQYVTCSDHVAGATRVVVVPPAAFAGEDQTGADTLAITVFPMPGAPGPDQTEWSTGNIAQTDYSAAATLAVSEGDSYRVCLADGQPSGNQGRVMTAGSLGDSIEATETAPAGGVVELSTDDRALLTAGFGVLVLLTAASTVSGWMRAG